MMAELKVSGDVQPSDYEAEEYLVSLDPVIQRLNNDIPQAGYDRRSLAQLVVQLQQFMEVALGIKSIPPRPFPKIPAKLLRDSSPYGALYTIATKCYDLTKQRGLKKIDFANPAKRKENMEILSLVRRELQRENFIKVFKVHIHPICQSGDMPRLQRIITQLASEIMPSENIPGVTHIVYPFGPKGDPDDGQEYLRCLEKRGASSLVHYWYHPDSYDRCIPAEVAPEVIEPDKRIRGPWKVNLRWVLDSENFNEWMNPVDYETEEAIAEQERLGLLIEGPSGEERGAKRRSDGGEGTEQAVKRQKQDQLNRAGRRGDVEQGKGESIAPGVTKQRLVNADARWGDTGTTENLSHGQQRPSSLQGPGPRTPQAPPPAADGPVSNGVPDGAPVQPQQELYRVPAYAAWFRYDRLHAQEVRGLPEFFKEALPTKSPRVYRDCRNLIVDLYREDPRRRLHFPAVQEALSRSSITTDADGLRRIFDFLDGWGLINYEAADGRGADSQPPAMSASGLPGTVLLGKAGGPFSSSEVLSFNMPPAKNLAAPVARAGEGMQSVLSRRDAYANSATTPAVQEARFFCNAMPWVDCTALRYHCTKLPDIDLCPEAYAGGRFPPGCTARDFIKIDGARPPPEKPEDWSDQETLLLLEGMEMYGENWAEIAEHVGTRSQVQCVMHFLRLPIEDDLAATQPGEPLGVSLNGSQPALAPSQQPIPFADTGNPIMAQVAFLASVVSPKVAAAAAQRALEVLASEDVNAAMTDGYIGLEEETPANGSVEPVAPPEPTESAPVAEVKPDQGDSEAPAPQAAPAAAPAVHVSGDTAIGEADGAADTEMEEPSAPASAAPADSAGSEAANHRDKPAAANGSAADGAPAEVKGASAVSLDGSIPAEKLRVAAATALAAAAVKARVLADAEEAEARRLTLEALEALLDKVARKAGLFDAMAAALRTETAAMEAEGDRLTAERIMLHKSRADMAAQLARLKAIQAAAQAQPMPSTPPAATQEAAAGSSGAAAPATAAPPSSTPQPAVAAPVPADVQMAGASVSGAPASQAAPVGGAAAAQGSGVTPQGVSVVRAPAPQQQQDPPAM